MPTFDVTSFGETMLRYSVPSGERLESARTLNIDVGGAESNVLAALAQIGRRCGYVTALPNSANGRRVLNELREHGLDISGIILREGGRVGSYYVEFATAPRSIQVIYDRAHSCASMMSTADVNWSLLLDTRVLHLTGITPALSQSCRELVQEALKRAHAAQVPVIVDVNYRSRLWAVQEAAQELSALCQGVHLLICKADDARLLFGCAGSPEQIIRRLCERSGAAQVILSAGDQGAYAFDGADVHHEPALGVQVTDRLGAGDALAAGIIDGWLDDDIRRGLRFGVVMAALALTQRGDMLITTRSEVEQLAQSKQPLIRR